MKSAFNQLAFGTFGANDTNGTKKMPLVSQMPLVPSAKQMGSHQYILEPYKGMNTRYHCPNCNHRDKTFVRYIDTNTGKYIAPTVGRCNRESNCGYHYTPKQYFQDHNITFDYSQPKTYHRKLVIPQPKPASYISVEVFKQSLQIDKNVTQAAETNHLIRFLVKLFGASIASELVSRYFIASSKHWEGATIFWQIDTLGKIRTGKIMLYNAATGKRVKEPYNHINWVHKVLKRPEFELKQCLFGEHLLKDKSKPVAIVESEKTAVISSVYLPQFIWLAAGSLTNLNVEKCSILKGRTVILFPDLNGFEKWSKKAKELSDLALFSVSDLLERKATEAEKRQGLDLADYLIRFDYKAFALPEPEATEPQPAIQPLVEVKAIEQLEPTFNFNKPQKSKPESWEQDINKLEHYFEEIILPSQPIKLNPYSKVTNVPLFIESHLAIVKANNGKQTYLPYLNRLQELKNVLTIISN